MLENTVPSPLVFGRSAGRRKKIRPLHQLTSTECGAACLAMILNYHGREISVAEVREACAIGRGGLDAARLCHVARSFGLEVNGYSASPCDLSQDMLPGILHWQFSHFVVLERWSERGAEIVDPAGGRRLVDHEEFDRSFTGVVLTFKPGKEFSTQSSERGSGLRRYLQLMRETPGASSLLVRLIGASLMLQLSGLALPLATKLLVDTVLPNRLSSFATTIGLGLAGVVAAQICLTYIRGVYINYLRARLDEKLLSHFLKKLFSLPFHYFQLRSTGDLLVRIQSVGSTRELLTNQAVAWLLDGPFFLVYFFLLLVLSPPMAAVAGVLAAAQAVLLLATRRRLKSLSDQYMLARSEEHGYLTEAIRAVPTIKSGGSEDRAFATWKSLYSRQLNTALERGQLEARLSSLTIPLQTSAPVILLWFGAYLVLNAGYGIGSALALSAIGTLFLGPVGSIIAGLQQLQMVLAQMERISDVLDAQPEQAQGDGRILDKLDGAIELKDVSFGFDGGDAFRIENVSCTIPAGAKAAIVGPTGSGKSTLGLLMLGFVQPDCGEIYFDGRPLSELNLRSLRSHMGVVFQDACLFGSTIAENISLHLPDTDMPKVMKAAREACIDQEILAMPLSYETPMAEGAGNVSGGQRQRIALARALARDPSVLLLDETTSHLDVETESRVDANLESLECTRVVIAHRLSTVRDADVILVMESGRLVESGTHDELIAAGGRYAELAAGQESQSTPAGQGRVGVPTAANGLARGGEFNAV